MVGKEGHHGGGQPQWIITTEQEECRDRHLLVQPRLEGGSGQERKSNNVVIS